MGVEFHDHADRFAISLDGFHDASTTSFTLSSGDGAALDAQFTYPVIFEFGTEHVEIASVAGDVATVVRERNGTTAASHNDGTIGNQKAAAYAVNEHTTALNEIYDVLFQALASRTNGVFRKAGSANVYFLVQQTGTPGMSADILNGSAFAGDKPVFAATAGSTGTLVAPITNDRIDTIQLNQFGVLSVKTGAEDVSPVAPTIDANNIKLAEIYHRPATTQILDTDDSTNSFITDSRTLI